MEMVGAARVTGRTLIVTPASQHDVGCYVRDRERADQRGQDDPLRAVAILLLGGVRHERQVPVAPGVRCARAELGGMPYADVVEERRDLGRVQRGIEVAL